MGDLDDDDLAREVGTLIAGNVPALSNEEVRAVLEKLREKQLREVFLALVERMRTLEKPLRLEAERDGWKQIATTLLKAAFGSDAEDYRVPPVELLQSVRRNARGEIEQGPPVAAIAQWWANLTMQDSQRRAKREHWREREEIVEASLQLRAAEIRGNGRGSQTPERGRWRHAVDVLDQARRLYGDNDEPLDEDAVLVTNIGDAGEPT